MDCCVRWSNNSQKLVMLLYSSAYCITTNGHEVEYRYWKFTQIWSFNLSCFCWIILCHSIFIFSLGSSWRCVQFNSIYLRPVCRVTNENASTFAGNSHMDLIQYQKIRYVYIYYLFCQDLGSIANSNTQIHWLVWVFHIILFRNNCENKLIHILKWRLN